jgi:hypothetical protein
MKRSPEQSSDQADDQLKKQTKTDAPDDTNKENSDPTPTPNIKTFTKLRINNVEIKIDDFAAVAI